MAKVQPKRRIAKINQFIQKRKNNKHDQTIRLCGGFFRAERWVITDDQEKELFLHF
jgi:hypothetical protein